MSQTEEKKVIPAKTVVKGLITGFVSYGIVLGFLLFVIAILFTAGISSLPNVKLKQKIYQM